MSDVTTERRIRISSIQELSNATFAALQRTCEDLEAVAGVVGVVGAHLPSFTSGAALRQQSATLRSQSASAFAAACALAASAASYETLAQVLDQSLAVRPAVQTKPAKAKKSARSRKP